MGDWEGDIRICVIVPIWVHAIGPTKACILGDNTCDSGYKTFHSLQNATSNGMRSSFLPECSPAMAWPSAWLQSDSLVLSYITKLLLYSLPEVPNSTVWSSIVRLNTWLVKHRGQ